MVSLLSFYGVFLVLPLICGFGFRWAARRSSKGYVITLAAGAVAAALTLFAMSNPIPGDEGPGLLAISFLVVAGGTLAGGIAARLIPHFSSSLSPALRCSGWLLCTYAASFPCIIE